MNGSELFDYYTSKRNYTGSAEDQYAQTLETILFSIGEDVYSLLEKAEKENKKLSLKENTGPPHDQYTMKNIILV